MDIYEEVSSILRQQSVVQAWPEMEGLLQKITPQEPRDWLLPLVACDAVCGDRRRALAAGAALAGLQISIILIDDMLDEDPKGQHHRLGVANTANLAAAFQAAALEVIHQAAGAAAVRLAVAQCLNEMVLHTAVGQDKDVQNPKDEAAYWEVVHWKSAPFFSAAMQAGALLGGAAPETAAGIKTLGSLYGEMIQIHDDLDDTMAVPANPDWILGRSPLPILFAEVVDHPQRERFLALRQAIPDPEALQEAQQILIRCGAVSYAVAQLLQRGQTAVELIAEMELARPQVLATLFEELVEPVRQLLAASGEEQLDFTWSPTFIQDLVAAADPAL